MRDLLDSLIVSSNIKVPAPELKEQLEIAMTRTYNDRIISTEPRLYTKPDSIIIKSLLNDLIKYRVVGNLSLDSMEQFAIAMSSAHNCALSPEGPKFDVTFEHEPDCRIVSRFLRNR